MTDWPTYTHATKYGPLTVTVFAGPTRAPEPRKYADPPQLERAEPAYVDARIRPPRTPLDTWPHDRIEPLRINGIEYDLDATLRQGPEGWKPPNGGWPRLRRMQPDGSTSMEEATDAARHAAYKIVDAIAAILPVHVDAIADAETIGRLELADSARVEANRHRAYASLYDELARTLEPFPARMMPGQDPYTTAELARLYRTVGAAADDDPGEDAEP